MFVYRKGGRRTRYEGENAEGGIVASMKEYLSLPSRELRNANDYKSLFRRNDQPAVIGLFPNEGDRLYQLFIDFAYNNRKHFQFGHSFQPISSLSDVQGPAIVLQHHPDVRSKFEKEKYVFNKVRSTERNHRLTDRISRSRRMLWKRRSSNSSKSTKYRWSEF